MAVVVSTSQNAGTRANDTNDTPAKNRGTSSNATTSPLPRNLRELRYSKCLRQGDVAKALGVPPSTYSSWERGRTEPSPSNLSELARFFDVTVDRLLRAEPHPLRIGMWYPPVGKFHPIKNPQGIFTFIYSLVFNRLYYFDMYEKRIHIETINSWLIDIKGCRPSYTFYLRQNVRFHSGKRLEPEDVKLSYSLYIYRHPFFKQFIDTVEVKKEDRSVKLNLHKWLELEFLPTPYIIPRSYLTRETWDEDDECFDGTGPFKVADEEQKKRLREGLKQPVTLECNDNYFGRIASIPAIEIHKTPNDKPGELKKMLLNGEVDLAYDLDLKESDMSLEESDEYCIEKSNRSIISYYLVLDRNSNICGDKSFRKAIDLAINRKRMVKMLDIKTARVLPANHLFLILREEAKGTSGYKMVKARSCWKKALSSLKKNGVKDTALRVGSTHYENPVISRIIDEVVGQLKQVGIDAQREEDQSNAHAFVEILKFTTPGLIYYNLHSSRTPRFPWNNDCKELDALLDDIKGKETYQQIQEILTEQCLFLPLLSRGVVVSHIKILNTNYRFRGTNILYGPDIVHWQFRERTKQLLTKGLSGHTSHMGQCGSLVSDATYRGTKMAMERYSITQCCSLIVPLIAVPFPCVRGKCSVKDILVASVPFTISMLTVAVVYFVMNRYFGMP